MQKLLTVEPSCKELQVALSTSWNKIRHMHRSLSGVGPLVGVKTNRKWLQLPDKEWNRLLRSVRWHCCCCAAQAADPGSSFSWYPGGEEVRQALVNTVLKFCLQNWVDLISKNSVVYPIQCCLGHKQVPRCKILAPAKDCQVMIVRCKCSS